MTNKVYNNIGKKLCYYLRHHPEEINLEMDRNGYVYVDKLIEGFNAHAKQSEKITKDILKQIVIEDGTRYSFSEDGLKICANYGHSMKSITPVLIKVSTNIPPFLLHGTSPELYHKFIKQQGLCKMNRNAVHLTDDKEEALRVGKRHCAKGEEPILLKVDIVRLLRDSKYTLYKTLGNKYLIEHVPAEYISVI